MTEEVKPEVIKKTQDTLRKHIRKPPLTDKLLKKPPFRFLHDIVTNVITETGFLNGLFTPEELNHENIKDRDGKVAFLDKLISAVKIITGIPLSVRATKIVAGHEPTKTNELLQAIGVALEKKLDSKDVAQQLRKKGNKKSEAGDTTKKASSKDSKKDSGKTKLSKQLEESKNVREEASERKKYTSPSSRTSKDVDKNSKPMKLKSKRDGGHHDPKDARPEEKNPIEMSPKQQEHVAIGVAYEDPGPKRPQSAVRQRRSSLGKQSSDERAQDSEQNISTKNEFSKVQNPTQPEEASREEEALVESKGIPPPVQEQGSQQEQSENKAQSSTNTSAVSTLAPVPLARPRTAARVGSARPGAPRVRNKGDANVVTEDLVRPSAVNLIVDGDNSKVNQEEDENLVVVENTPIDDPSSTPDARQAQGSPPSSQQGHLVAQILETQKELDVSNSGLDSEENLSHHTEIEWEAGKKRERESASKEMERMRALVQTLTRASHPLGKLLDSLQEDIDNMQRELLQWQNMQTSLEQQLKIEESLSAQATQPLKEQLKQLQQAVRTQLDQLSASKANILNSDQRIHQLLTGGQG